MKIESVELKAISIPMVKPFKTALRTVTCANNIIVLIRTDDGRTGYGEAPPTKPITGDTTESIIAAIRNHIGPALTGLVINPADDLSVVNAMEVIQTSIADNTSPKAACDMALYDLIAQQMDMPLFRYLGGSKRTLETDLTISINSPEEMREDALSALYRGFNVLKLKVGIDPDLDIERIRAIRKAVGPDIGIRLDANQGWTPEEAVRVMKEIESEDLNIEFIEQPVKAADFEGLKYVRQKISTKVMADESIFSPDDARRLLEMEAIDLINIKLMKCGGIYNALRISDIAKEHDVECMLGCMCESKVSLAAAVHLATARTNITRVDLDAAILLAKDPVSGGYIKDIPYFTATDAPGLGIIGIEGLKDI